MCSKSSALHFDGFVFDSGAYQSMREHERLRRPWLMRNPGKDQDDYHEWFTELERRRLMNNVHTDSRNAAA